MKVTVVIPTFNREEEVLRAIESAINQTYSSLEIIVVDDYSKDNTREVVQSIDDDRVRYVLNQRSKGAQGARNTGVELAQGEWIAFLDSDDWWRPEKIERQIAFINRSDENVAALSTGRVWKMDGRTFWKSGYEGKKKWGEKVFLHDNPIGGFSSLIVRKEVLNEVGGLDEDFESMQDMDIFFRLARRGCLFSMPDHLTVETIRSVGGISRNYSRKLRSSKLMLNKYKSEYKDNMWIYVYRRANIAIYSILAKRWDTFFENFPFVLLGFYMCPGKTMGLIKKLLLAIGIVQRANIYVKSLYV